MRIAISCHPTQGGSGVVATELAAALAERGHQLHLVACDKPFRHEEGSPVRFHKVNVPDYPLFRYPPHDLSLANKLATLTKEHNLDIIHAHYAVPHAVSAMLANQIVQPHRVRIVTTLHGTDITLVGSHTDFYDLTRHAIVSSDAVTSVSAWLSNETARLKRVLEQLLALSRIDAGVWVLHPAHLSIAEYVEALGEKLAPRAGDKGI